MQTPIEEKFEGTFTREQMSELKSALVDNMYGKDELTKHKSSKGDNGDLDQLKSQYSTIQIPSCGRMVQYIAVDNEQFKNNPQYCQSKFPAIVVEASDLFANLNVFTLDKTPIVTLSVPHISVATRNEDGNIVSSYWIWPVINK